MNKSIEHTTVIIKEDYFSSIHKIIDDCHKQVETFQFLHALGFFL